MVTAQTPWGGAVLLFRKEGSKQTGRKAVSEVG